MSAQELSVVILAVVGAVLQLIFQIPSIKNWYEAQANKGPIMLAAVVLVGAAYFGLSCTPFAASLKIVVECSQAGAFSMLQALFVIATGNQLTYLLVVKGR